MDCLYLSSEISDLFIGVKFKPRHKKLFDMKQKIWASPRHAFCWLDEKMVIVVSFNKKFDNGHCVLLDTVSKTIDS